jgi:CubicO group peptidase (beta-lactamase class C family)
MFIDKEKLKNIGLNEQDVSDVLKALESDELTHIKTLMLYQNGPIVSFEKEPYNLDHKQLLFSITKSVTSMAVAIAIDKGLLTLDDKLISFFPDKNPSVCGEQLSQITIENLLTMTSGLHNDTYEVLFKQSDWIKAFLHQEFIHQPGSYFRYSTHGSHMLSAVIQQVTGQTLNEFVQLYLFEPLGILDYDWEMIADGTTTGGMGLSLKTEDLCKLADMFVHDGVYNNMQIISKTFIDKAIQPHIVKSSEVDSNSKNYSGEHYGYQIHIGKEGCYRFDGAFGQVCLIEPHSKLVIVVTSQYSKLEPLLKHLHQNIIERLNKKQDVKVIDSKLVDYRNSFGIDVSVMVDMVFELENNPNKMTSIHVYNKNELIRLKINYLDHKSTVIDFNTCSDNTGECYFVNDITWKDQKYNSVVERLNDKRMVLKVFILETPYVLSFDVDLEGKMLDFKINKSFTIKNFSIGDN